MQARQPTGPNWVYEGSVHGPPIGSDILSFSSGSWLLQVSSISFPSNQLDPSDVLAFAKALAPNILRSIDLSRNDLGVHGMTIAECLLVTCKSLTSLDLSSTGLSDDADFSVCGRFEKLVLDGNKIGNVGAKKIAAAIAGSTVLKRLSLGNNAIEEAGALDIAKAIGRSTVLCSLNLAQNLFRLNKAGSTLINVLVMNTSLSVIDAGQGDQETLSLVMRQNALFMDALQDFKIVNSSFNNRRWSSIPSQIYCWGHMQSLNISDNNLTELPFAILSLSELVSLNVANNSISISALPVHLCKLPKLQKLSVRGNPFVSDLPPAVSWRECSSLLRYFHEVAMSPVSPDAPMGECGRVLVLGEECVGKTTLIKTLNRANRTKIKESFVRLKKRVRDSLFERDVTEGIHITGIKVSDECTWQFWDFAGQLVYYPTHQFFLQPNSVFMVCFSLMNTGTLLRLQYWIEIILSKVANADIIIVGTHRDRCSNPDEVLNSLRQRYSRLKSIVLHGVFAVNGTVSTSVAPLRTLIAGMGNNASFSNTKSPTPRSFGFLKSMISASDVPTVSLRELYQMCDSCFVLPNDRSKALGYLQRSGVVLWYDRVQALEDTVVCDPQWLINVMARIVTSNVGKFSETELLHMWPPHLFPNQKMIVKILEAFEIIHRMKTVVPSTEDIITQYVVPCVLPETEPTTDIQRILALTGKNTSTIYRIYRFKFMPPGFVPQLCVRILHLTSLHGAIWRTGVCSLLEEDDGYTRHCLMVRLEPHSNHSDVVLEVTTSDWSGKAVHVLVSAVESLLRGWYSSVQYSRFIRMANGAEASVDELLQTLMDIRSKENFYRLSGTIKKYESVAPDLLLRRTKRIRDDELGAKKEIGSGAFGFVFAATYEGEQVVVKEIRGLMQDTKDTFGTFQNECCMMTLLQHDKIIKLIGICLHPTPSLVMELAVFGDLRHLLDKEEEFPLYIRQKIAFDVAEAMCFCHRLVPKIIHRDLKSPNVFLSINSKGFLVAKVADLGLATVLPKVQKEAAVENPIWLAPEGIMRQAFDEKIDVFAFGIIMYELYTLRWPYADHLGQGFMAALGNEIVKGLRPGPLPNTSPEYVELMKRCWQHDPALRPSFREIVHAMGTIFVGTTEPKPDFTLRDLGSADTDSLSPVLGFDVYQGMVYMTHRSGCITRLDLTTGVGHRVADVGVTVVANYEGCVSSGEGGAFVGSRGQLQFFGVDEQLHETSSGIVRFAFMCSVKAFRVMIGYSENALTNVVCEVRDGHTLSTISTFKLLSSSQRVLACCATSGDMVWVLYQEGEAHLIKTIHIPSGKMGRVNVPAERCPHYINCVGNNMVWGLCGEAVVVWKEDGSFMHSFDPSKASNGVNLGIWLSACAGPHGHVVVSSAQALSLWHASSRKMITWIPAASYAQVAFDKLTGQGVALGAKLRLFAVIGEVSSSHVERIHKLPKKPKNAKQQDALAVTATLSDSVASTDQFYLSDDNSDLEKLSLPSLQFSIPPPMVSVVEPIVVDEKPPAVAAPAQEKSPRQNLNRISVGEVEGNDEEDEFLKSTESLARILRILNEEKVNKASPDYIPDEGSITLPVISMSIETTSSQVESTMEQEGDDCEEDDVSMLMESSRKIGEMLSLARSSGIDDNVFEASDDMSDQSNKKHESDDDDDDDDEVVFVKEQPKVLPEQRVLPPPLPAKPDRYYIRKPSLEKRVPTFDASRPHSVVVSSSTMAPTAGFVVPRRGADAPPSPLRKSGADLPLRKSGSDMTTTPAPPLSPHSPNGKMSGYLRKRGEKGIKAFKTRYFELSGIELLYWASHMKDGPQLGSIALTDVSEIQAVGDKPDTPMLALITTTRTYFLNGTISELRSWLEAIRVCRDIPVKVDEYSRGWDDYFGGFIVKGRMERSGSLSNWTVRSSSSQSGTASPRSPPKSPRNNTSPRTTGSREALQKVSNFLFRSGSGIITKDDGNNNTSKK